MSQTTFEGTWEEIIGHAREFAGKRVRVTVVEEPARPEPARVAFYELAERLMVDVPEEELRALPPDGASEHDHYLYWTPKRNP